jgi:predicted SpoU family rRNA methylase
VIGTQHVSNLVRMYRSQEDDLKWARNIVVALVVNGEAIPMVQNRIEDAGFTNLDIIMMGADKVFIRSLSDLDVLKKVEEASEFFNQFLSNFKRWDKTVVPFQRGVWFRLYGIPLHAWNESFFKLCVLNYG